MSYAARLHHYYRFEKK